MLILGSAVACGGGDGDAGPRLIVLNGVSGDCPGSFEPHTIVTVWVDGEEAAFNPIGELWTTRIDNGVHDVLFRYASVDCDGESRTSVNVQGDTLVAVWGDPVMGSDIARAYPALRMETMDELVVANLSQQTTDGSFQLLVDGEELAAQSLNEGDIVVVPLDFLQPATIEWTGLGLSEAVSTPGSGGTIFSVRVCLLWDDIEGPVTTCTWTSTIG